MEQDTTPALAAVETLARDFERARRDLIFAATEAHLDGDVSANKIAVAIARYAGGPGWGRDRLLAQLAAARDVRTAVHALADAGIRTVQAHFESSRNPDSMALLYVTDPAVVAADPLDLDLARRIVALLAAAGLTLDVTGPAETLARLPAGAAVPLARITPPAPKRARTAADEGPFFCVVNVIAVRDGHEVLVAEHPDEPYRGLPALPGNDIDPNGPFTIVAHARDAADAIGLSIDHEQFYRVGIYQDPETDPRGHITNLTWAVAVPDDTPAPDDHSWADIDTLLVDRMALDHARLLADAYKLYRNGAFGGVNADDQP